MHLYSDEVLFKKTSLTTHLHNPLTDANQRVMIIYDELINESLKGMIQNMMKACGLSINEYHLLYLKEKNISWKKLNQMATPIKEIIIFGELENKLSLNIQFKVNLPIQFDQKVWIKTHSLKEINEQQVKKANFWNQALKPYFTR